MNSNKILQLTRELEQISVALERMRGRAIHAQFNADCAPKSYFPELAPKWEHHAEIRRMAYARIKLIYLKKLDEITSIV